MKTRMVFYGAAVLSLCACFYILADTGGAMAASGLKPYIDTLEQSQKGMTMWQLIKTGGVIMIFLTILSVGAIACIAYNFTTLTAKKLLPPDFAESVMDKLNKKRFQLVDEMCRANDNLLASFIHAGLEKKEKGPVAVKEAMELRARRDIASIWQNLGYLSDIAMISPMVGLLGTVLGMIQAFNVIAFQTAVVKPILLAGGVSKAMITTAGGLIVAIPAMIFYAYFRGRAQVITHGLEGYLTDITKMMGENQLAFVKKSK